MKIVTKTKMGLDFVIGIALIFALVYLTSVHDAQAVGMQHTVLDYKS